MPTIVGILIFMSRIKFMLIWERSTQRSMKFQLIIAEMLKNKDFSWFRTLRCFIYPIVGILTFMSRIKVMLSTSWVENKKDLHPRGLVQYVGLSSPEQSLLAYIEYGCRWRFRPKYRTLSLPNTSACAFRGGICVYAMSDKVSWPGPLSLLFNQ